MDKKKQMHAPVYYEALKKLKKTKGRSLRCARA